MSDKALKEWWQALKNGIESTWHAGQSMRLSAQQMDLPATPERLIKDYEHFAHTLPDELPQKEAILNAAIKARAFLESGDHDEVKFYMLRMQMNWRNAVHDKWVSGVMKQYAEQGRTRNAEVKRECDRRAAEVKREAEKIKKEFPSTATNKSELARRVKRRLSSPLSLKTIKRDLERKI